VVPASGLQHAIASLVIAGGARPAGGADTAEVVLATAGSLAVAVAMVVVLAGHRSGRLRGLARLAAFAERRSGIPGWASLPLAIAFGSLLTAALGMYWDISIHIDEGRDPGPLANAAHYLILIGLFGIVFAGATSLALPRARPSATAVRLGPGWYGPVGGLVIFVCGSFALSGFPLDDVWHRLFGQDVTLWGPTHLLLIGGASLSTIGAAMLLVEGQRARTSTAGAGQRWLWLGQAAVVGAVLVGLSTFQAEFDFSVPQFRLLFHPILLMLAASIALVAARIQIGRGGALLAVASFLAIRGLISLYVGPLTGHTTLHFPLYLVEAAVVELVALRIPPTRPVALGATAGLGIGTVGLAAEWGWSHVWATIPWSEPLLPEAPIAGLVAGLAGGVIGAFVGTGLAPPEAGAKPRRALVAAAAVAIVLVLAYPLPMEAGPSVRADITLTDVRPEPARRVAASVRLEPPNAAERAEWFTVTAWQGGGSVVDPLERVGPGVYRTMTAIPVHGNWKTTLRLHRGDVVTSVPIYFPADPAIPEREIPAPPRFQRRFVLDKENLRREEKEDVPAALTTFGYVSVLAIAVFLIATLAWGLVRMDRGRERRTLAR
jgi:hypothetical protein